MPWTGNSIIEQFAVRPPNDRFVLTTSDSDVSNGALIHTIHNATDPSAYFLRIYRNNIQTDIENFRSDPERFIVFPNPANELIRFRFRDHESRNLTIKNIYGQEVVFFEHFNSDFVDVSQLQSGLYFISDGITSIRFLKI